MRVTAFTVTAKEVVITSMVRVSVLPLSLLQIIL